MKNTALTFALLFSSLSFAYDLQLNSGKTQTQIIELYTSEGCSSCPPADRWLSSLKNKAGVWKDFIPVAFHVGYWDYIGWKDELAMPANASRQRLHKKVSNLSSVYTPGVLKRGKEWRRWPGASVNRASKKVGQFQVNLKANELTAIFNSQRTGTYTLVVALLGMNIETKVLAGENRGELLKHDFVLLKQQIFESNNNRWNVTLDDLFFQTKHKNTAFVAWIEKLNNPAPIQAVGTLL